MTGSNLARTISWSGSSLITAAANVHTYLSPTPLDGQVVQLMHGHQQAEEGLIGGYLLGACQHSLYIRP